MIGYGIDRLRVSLATEPYQTGLGITGYNGQRRTQTPVGQPRVSSTLTFGTTRLGTKKTPRLKSGGLRFSPIGEMYTSCTQTVLIWEIVSASLGLPLQ
jgi:hypothetical protein